MIIDDLTKLKNRQNIRNAKLVEETEKYYKIAILTAV